MALRTISNALLIGAAVLFVLSFGPVVKDEILYQVRRIGGIYFTLGEKEPSPEHQSPFGALLGGPRPVKITPASTYFGLVIEKIGVNAPVVPNVEVTDKEAYMKALKEGVAHAKGTAKPGEPGNCYLFAHSSLDFWRLGRYATVFNLLHKLKKGDRIAVFYRGKRFDYKVTDKEIVSGFNTKPLTRTFKKPHLTLQNCHPPGTTLNRLIVTAVLTHKD